MGLNDIRLNSAELALLYPKSLVEFEKQSIKEAVAVPVSAEAIPAAKEAISNNENWKSLGDNRKNILVVVDYEKITHLPDEELDFLTAILAACNLTLGDVTIINKHHYTGTGYQDIVAHFSSKIILLFGTDPAAFGLPLSFPEFQVQAFANSTFLYTPDLEACRKDKLLKSKLWVCLRSIFGIK